MKTEVLRSIHAVTAQEWDTLVGDGCPFFEHAFLAAVEDAGCVGPGTGWSPRHLVVRDGGRAVAASAGWEKLNSNAEFVFDWGWADAAARAGIPYYPKLLMAAPFSPVGGARMHLEPGADAARAAALRATLVSASLAYAREASMSGVHWLFASPDEATALAAGGLALRHTVQYHWTRGEAQDFEGFLVEFDSKKRNQIRRERREVAAAGVTVRALTGDDLSPEHAPLLWALYSSTVDKFVWGQRYLNPAFFERLLATWRHRLLVLLAYRDGRVVGGTINAAKAGVMYGRYWGALGEDIPFLHFEVCTYAAISHCLDHGFSRFEAGAGGGGHKHGRGLWPAVTQSAHVLFHPGLDQAVRRFVKAEREALAGELEGLEAGRRIRKPGAV